MLSKFNIAFKTTTETFHTLMKITILHIMLFIKSLNYLTLNFDIFVEKSFGFLFLKCYLAILRLPSKCAATYKRDH